MPIRLAIVASDALIRAGIAALLSNVAADLEIAGTLTPVDAARGDLRLYALGAALWIIDSPSDLNALNDANESNNPAIPALVLTTINDAPACWTAGASAVLPRDVTPTRMIAALAAMQAGLAITDPAWTAMLQNRRATTTPNTTEAPTPREREVLTLLAEGYANKTIATQLGISENTVKFHLNAIMTKLDAQSRTDAVVRAARLGWLTL